MTEVAGNRHAVTSRLVQASRKWRKLAQQALAAHGISPARATALLWVHRLGGGVRQVTLATYVGIEGTSLVRLLDELSAAGLLVRREDCGDRRAKTIWLTAEGERLACCIEQVLADLGDRVFIDASAADIEATLRICDAIDVALDTSCEPAAEALALTDESV